MKELVVDPEQNQGDDGSPQARDEAKAAEDELSLSGRAQVISHRHDFKDFAFGIVQAWVGFLMVITFMQISLRPIGMHLEPEEFIALFTTSTATIFFLARSVGNYLFPRGGASYQKDGR